MPEKTRVIHYGLGPIGALIARTALERGDFLPAGAIDTDPAKAGRDLSEVAGTRQRGIIISPDAQAILNTARPCVVLHSTVSHLEHVKDQIRACIEAGHSVVSTSEELAYPWMRDRAWSREIDRRAKDYGVTVIGSGSTPGS